MQIRNSRVLLRLGMLVALVGPGLAWSAAGSPLPRCSRSDNAFYLLRYAEGNPGSNTLSKVSVSGSGSGLAGAETSVWSGQSPGTVAAGMRPQDGYIYGIRAVSRDSADAPATWQQDFRAFQVIRYGSSGADNLGVIDASGFATTGGTPDHSIYDPSPNPNFNAADIDPKTGQLVVGMLRDGNYGRSSGAVAQMQTLLHIDVTKSPPQLVKVTQLDPLIPLTISGDFAIDATGTYAYGVTYTAPVVSGFTMTSPAQSYFWRAELATGAVTQQVASLPVSDNPFALALSPSAGDQPYGGGALLPDGTYAFYANQTPLGVSQGTTTEGRLLNIDSAGTVLGYAAIAPGSNSADAARCLPKLEATLTCTPAEIWDSAGNVATCTVTLDGPAPAEGLQIALDALASNPRYSTSCGTAVTVPAGATQASCTVTATPNTDVGDGDVPVTLQLSPPAANADYVLGTPAAATVTVRDDDNGAGGATPVPTLQTWALGMLGGLLAALAGWRRRKAA